MKKWKEESI